MVRVRTHNSFHMCQNSFFFSLLFDRQENEEFLFTNSQTQLLDSVLVSGDPTFVGQDGVHPAIHPVETEIFNNVGNYADHAQSQIPTNQGQVDDQLYHPGYFLPVQQTLPMQASSTQNEVPAMEMWPGHLNFEVEFGQSQDKTKATPWIVRNI